MDEALYRRFFEKTQVAYLGVLDANGRVALCSNAPLSRGGLRLEDVVGKPFWDTDWFADCEESRQAIRDLVTRAQNGETAEVETSYRTAEGAQALVRAYAEPVVGAGGQVEEILVSGIDDTARLLAERQKALILREADHRMKNILTMIAAVARLTARSTETVAEFLQGFDLRLMAIAATHDLTRSMPGNWADLDALVRGQLSPFVDLDGAQVRTGGPAVRLPSGQAQSLGLVLHELATNATKYGALSTPAGRVEVSWSDAGDGQSRLVWAESGGPPVCEPERRGFGTAFVSALLTPLTEGQSPRLEFRPEGFRAEFAFTADACAEPAHPAEAASAAAR